MEPIKNVSLKFSCPEKRSTLIKNGNHYDCNNCSHQVIDFTNKSAKDFEQISKRSKGTFCGIFSKNQLSREFVKYAAATIIVSSSMTLKSLGQSMNEEKDLFIDGMEEELTGEVSSTELMGLIVESSPEPEGGMAKFYKTVYGEIKWPSNLKKSGRIFIQFNVDTLGIMRDIEVIKGFDQYADQEALRVFHSLNYPFKPARLRQLKVESRMVVPVIFKYDSAEGKPKSEDQ